MKKKLFIGAGLIGGGFELVEELKLFYGIVEGETRWIPGREK